MCEEMLGTAAAVAEGCAGVGVWLGLRASGGSSAVRQCRQELGMLLCHDGCYFCRCFLLLCWRLLLLTVHIHGVRCCSAAGCRLCCCSLCLLLLLLLLSCLLV